MNWEALGAIGELIGALVVVGSVFYLSRQIKESNKHARGEVTRHIQHTWNQFLGAGNLDDKTRETIRRGHGSFDTLSDSEKTVFFNFVAQITDHLEMVLRLEAEGLVSRDTADTYQFAIVGLIATPGGRELWEIASTICQPLAAKCISEKLNDPSTISFSDKFPFLMDRTNVEK
jgi:hypothetical protein